MAEIGDKYHEADTEYTEEDDAEYNASDFNYQIVDLSGDIVALFADKEERDKVLLLLNLPPKLAELK